MTGWGRGRAQSKPVPSLASVSCCPYARLCEGDTVVTKMIPSPVLKGSQDSAPDGQDQPGCQGWDGDEQATGPGPWKKHYTAPFLIKPFAQHWERSSDQDRSVLLFLNGCNRDSSNNNLSFPTSHSPNLCRYHPPAVNPGPATCQPCDLRPVTALIQASVYPSVNWEESSPFLTRLEDLMS